MNVLITGITGFVGTWLLEEIKSAMATEEQFADAKFYFLIRPANQQKLAILKRDCSWATLVKGDLVRPEIIMAGQEIDFAKIDTVIHAAASYDLTANYADCFVHNVTGTLNLLALCRQMPNLKKIIYISTIAVSGDYQGIYKEDNFELGQKFADHYSKTKYSAEQLVRDFYVNRNADEQKPVDVVIVRPGIIIGDSESGQFTNINGPYYFLQWLRKIHDSKIPMTPLLTLPLPFGKQASFPLVPVNVVSKAIAQELFRQDHQKVEGKLSCFHVVPSEVPNFKTFVEDSFSFLGHRLKAIPIPWPKLGNFALETIGLPKELTHYTYSKCQYDNKNFVERFGPLANIGYQSYRNIFFQSAYKKFRSGHTL